MRPIALTTLAVAALAGCSLFGAEAERLTGTTLFQTDSLTTVDADSASFTRPLLLLSSSEEEATFRRRYGIAMPFPGVDYATSTLVVAIDRSTRAGGRVTIRAVELVGDDRVRVSYEVAGGPRGSGPVRYPLHVVRVSRIADLAGRTIEGTGTAPPL